MNPSFPTHRLRFFILLAFTWLLSVCSLSAASRTLSVAIVGQGSVTVTPDQATYDDGTIVTLTAHPSTGHVFIGWEGASQRQVNPLRLTMTSNLALTAGFAADFTPTLEQAVETSGLVWLSSSEAPWITQATFTHDGADAAQSASIVAGESWAKTTVTGPGTLSFWWKLNSNLGLDYFKFYLGGVAQPDHLTQQADWQHYTIQIPDGNQELKWSYSKYFYTGGGGGSGVVISKDPPGIIRRSASPPQAAWLDQVSWQPETAKVAWYVAHFSTDELSNPSIFGPGADPDGDGNTNQQEFGNGTDPRNPNSAKYSLTLNQTPKGTVQAAPIQSLYDKGAVVTLTAIPGEGTRFGGWLGSESGNTNPLAVTMNSNKTIEAHFGLVSLTEALDDGGLTWSTDGDQPWFKQTTSTHDGVDAVQSGPLPLHQNSWIETKVAGPAFVSFWAKSETTHPEQNSQYYFQLSLNGTNVLNDLSHQEWTQYFFYVGPGWHDLKWSHGYYYLYDQIEEVFSTGSLDQVELQPSGALALWLNTYFSPSEQADFALSGFSSDPDQDNSTNLQEFQNGTDPRNGNSARYRLSLITKGSGSTAASPSQLLYDKGSVITLTATPGESSLFAGWRGDHIGQSATTQITMNANKIVTGDFGQDVTALLEPALETSGLTWISGGDSLWKLDSIEAQVTEDSAQCGQLAFGQESWLQTTVTGPALVSYWDKDTRPNNNYFYLDGIPQGATYDVWDQKFFRISAGEHTLRWSIQRNNGLRTLRIDQVKWDPNSPILAWMNAHFSPAELEQNAISSLDADPDNDWLSNKDEFDRGTDPRDSNSAKYRLDFYANSGGTIVTAFPQQRFYDKGSKITLTAIPDQGNLFAGWQTFPQPKSMANQLEFVVNQNTFAHAEFSADHTSAFEPALDSSRLKWMSSPTAPWFPQTEASHDGVDALKSVPPTYTLEYGSQTWVQTTLKGPGIFSFWLKTSTQAEGTSVYYLWDGYYQGSSATSGEWKRQSVTVAPGLHRFRLIMQSPPGPQSLSNEICLDQVEWQDLELSPWIAAHFTDVERNDTLISGLNADPDNDGIPNLLEFVLGGTPNLPDGPGLSKPLVETSPVDGGKQLVLTVPHTSSLGNLSVRFQTAGSPTATIWHDVVNGVGGASVTDVNGQFEVRLPVSENSLFLRMVVTQP